MIFSLLLADLSSLEQVVEGRHQDCLHPRLPACLLLRATFLAEHQTQPLQLSEDHRLMKGPWYRVSRA